MTNEEIKTKYGKDDLGRSVEITKISVNNGVKDLHLYVKQPTRYQISPIIGIVISDMVGATERLLSECCITEISDFAEIMENDSLFMAVMPEVIGMIEQKKSISTKL